MAGGRRIPFGKGFNARAKEVRIVTACYDKDGFRDYDHPIEKIEPGIVRIELLGSSQTYGLGLETRDSIPYLLGQELNHRAMDMGLPYHFEVFNFAMPCIYLPSMFQIYEKFGRKYKPDLAIYEYCEPARVIGLDIEDRIRMVKRVAFYQHLMKSDWGKLLLNRIFMLEHFAVASWVEFTGPPAKTVRMFHRVCKQAKKDHTITAFFEYWDMSRGLDDLTRGCNPWIFASGVDRRAFKALSYDNGNHPDEGGGLYYGMGRADRILSDRDPLFR